MAKHRMNQGPAVVAEKWANRLGAAVQDWTNGVNAVQTAPGQAAAAQKAVYIARVQAMANKWATRVAAVSLQQWQSATISKGSPILAQRATLAVPKMTQFMNNFLPVMARAVQQLPPKVKGDINNALSRVRVVIEAAMAYGQQAK